MSASLNTLSGTIYEDFIKPLMPKSTTEKTASNIMKCLVIGLGIFSTAMVFVVENLGSMLPLSISFGGMTGGPLLGMFSLGMLVPFANTKGALYGAITGIVTMGWIVFGAQYHIAQGAQLTPKLPLSTESCSFLVELSNTTSTATYTPFYPYRISFYYYGLLGFIITMIVGIIVSLATGGTKQNISRDLLSPVIYCLLPKKNKYHHEYNSVELANEILAKNIIKEKPTEE